MAVLTNPGKRGVAKVVVAVVDIVVVAVVGTVVVVMVVVAKRIIGKRVLEEMECRRWRPSSGDHWPFSYKHLCG